MRSPRRHTERRARRPPRAALSRARTFTCVGSSGESEPTRRPETARFSGAARFRATDHDRRERSGNNRGGPGRDGRLLRAGETKTRGPAPRLLAFTEAPERGRCMTTERVSPMRIGDSVERSAAGASRSVMQQRRSRASGRGPDHDQRSVSAPRGPQTGRGKPPVGTEVRVRSIRFCFSRPSRSGTRRPSWGLLRPFRSPRSFP